METLHDYLETIQDEKKRAHLYELIKWVEKTYPMLELRIAWKQPMFVANGTFIIGFSASAKHFAIAPEVQVLNTFIDKIAAVGYSCGKNVFRIKWEEPINYSLLEEIIAYTIDLKKDCTTFWLK